MTMPELADELADGTGVQTRPDAIGRFLRKLGFTSKKDVGRDRATPRKGTISVSPYRPFWLRFNMGASTK